MARSPLLQRFAALALAVLLVLAAGLPAGRALAAGTISLNPSSIAVGYSSPVSVTVTGTGTTFVAGDTTVSVLSGATNTGAATAVSVTSSTALSFTLQTGLEAGSYTVRVRTSATYWDTTLQITTPQIAAMSPTSTYVGYSSAVQVSLTGQGTNWVQGQTTVSLVGGTAAISAVSVGSATSLSFSLGTGLGAGAYSFRVTTGDEVVDTGTFTVRNPSVSLSQTSVEEGYTDPVSITATGTQTAFSSSTVVSLLNGSGTTVTGAISGVTSVSATSVEFTLNTGRSAGSYTVQLKTGSEAVSASFTVTAKPEQSISLSTASANEGYSPFNVTVTGANTGFVNGQSTVSVVTPEGSLVRAATGVNVTNSTQLSFTFPAGVEAGTYKIRVQTGADEVTSGDFIIATPSISLNPASAAAPLSAAVTVTVTGVNTNFAQGTTSAQLLDASSAMVSGVGSASVSSATQLTFTIPSTITAGTYTVRIATGDQVVTASFSVSDRVVEFTNTTSSLTANERTGALTLRVVDAEGTPTSDTQDVTVNLISSSSGGLFYTSGSGGSAVATVTIPSGSSSVTFYYEDTLPGTAVLTASASGFGSAQHTVTVTQAAIAAVGASTPGGFTAGDRSEAITLQLLDGQNRPVKVANATTITLGKDSARTNGAFYKSASGSTVISSVTVSAGKSSATVYYGDTLAGDATVTGTAGSATGSGSVLVNPAAGSSLRFRQSSASTAVVGQKSGALILRLEDPFGNAAPAQGSGVTITLSSTSSTGAVDAGAAAVTQVLLPAGQSELNLYYTDTKAGTATVTATGASVQSASRTVTVSAAAPTTLVFATPARSVVRLERSSVLTVQLKDAQGNPAKATANLSVSLASTSATGKFYTASAGGSAVTGVTIATGQETASFYYEDSKAGTPSIAVSVAGLEGASQSLTVAAGPPAKLAVPTAPASVKPNQRAAITVQVRDAGDTPVSPTAPLVVSLSGTGGSFYGSATSTTVVTAVTVPTTATSATFYFTSTDSGTYALAFSADGLTTAETTVTVKDATGSSGGAGGGSSGETGGTGETDGPAETGGTGETDGTGEADGTGETDGTGDTGSPVSAGPVEAESPTGKVSTTVQNGTADVTAVVDPQKVDVAALTGSLVVDLSAPSVTVGEGSAAESVPVANRAAEIPASLLNQLQASGANLVIQAGAVEMAIPPGALLQSGGGKAEGTIRLTVATIDLSQATGAPADAVMISQSVDSARAEGLKPAGQVLAFTATVTDNGQETPLSQFGQKLTVRIRYTSAQNPLHLGIYRLNRTTRQWEFKGGKVNTAGQYVEVGLDSFSEYTVMEFTRSFADVDTAHWAKADIEQMAARHIVKGVSETTFDPSGSVTRAQFAAMIVRALGLARYTGSEQTFGDVPAAAWFYEDVETAARAGLITGHAGQFRPADLITRQEMAVILVRALKLQGKETALSAAAVEAKIGLFADSGEIATWAQTSAATAVDLGLIKGRTAQTYAPTANASRAEAVVVLKRLLQALDEL